MFGYIRILKPELKVREYNRYRSFYCGLCRVLKKNYGFSGAITLTYDMTFLVMLLNSLYEPEEQTRTGRCELHPLTRRTFISSEMTAYGADMNILLAYYKQLDDWHDDHDPKGLAMSGLLKRRARGIISKYPRQAEAVRTRLHQLSLMEKNQVMEPDTAADLFGELLGQIFCMKEDVWKQKLYEMGFYMGRFIYLADALSDLEQDKKHGKYNPFSEKEPTQEEAKVLLTTCMAECAARFETLPVLRDVEILRNILYAGVWSGLPEANAEERQADAE